VARDRILETPEGARIALAGQELTFIDAPGHARHHVVLRDARTGLDRDGRQFSFPTTRASQFDPQALHRSIERMISPRTCTG
jgi:glyoxylase-like metal-dependent hydrolase (beta-lactamase superfamily II)